MYTKTVIAYKTPSVMRKGFEVMNDRKGLSLGCEHVVVCEIEGYANST